MVLVSNDGRVRATAEFRHPRRAPVGASHSRAVAASPVDGAQARDPAPENHNRDATSSE